MAETRPNVLVFMPDQLRADALGCFGNALAHTPNIDALAARGTRFTQAFVNHPVCSPSRVNLMTGWYPHTRGHRTLTHLVQPHEPNLLRYLKDGGYQVAFAGHRGDMFAPGVTQASTHFCGWTTRPVRGEMSMGPCFSEDSPLYHAFFHGIRPTRRNWVDFDEAATRTAVDWLSRRPRGPWCLFVPLIFPHLPFEVEPTWHALHADKPMPAPIDPARCIGKPGFMASLRGAAHLDELSPEQWAEITRIYYAMISRVDDQLGRILQAVDAIGSTAATDVYFFTDHGEYLGDFGLVEKWPSGLDPCLTRNPLIVAGPGVREGATCGHFVEMVDILPTVLERADLQAGHSHFGRSFATALSGGDSDAARPFACCEGGFRREDEALLERPAGEYALKGRLQHEQPELVGKAFCLRNQAWSYVWRQYEGEELYDRATDPDETRNLLAERPGDAAAEAAVAGLRQQLLAWLADTSDVIPWQPDPRFPEIPNGQHQPFEP
ncbi:MAG: sulfatase-like hydrolase/transferase [Pseudomonadales bacterium]